MFQQLIDDIIGRHPQPSDREDAARRLIETCGYAAAAATLLPIPGTELVAVMPIHVGMIVGLGQLYDAEVSRDSATELILRIGATVGASLFTTRTATTVAKIVLPGLGGLLGAPLIFATTVAIGAVACAFFDRGGEVSSDEMRKIYREAVRGARRDFDPGQARSEKAKEMAKSAADAATPGPAPADDADPVARLKKLRDLFEAGLIEPDEYRAARARIIEAL